MQSPSNPDFGPATTDPIQSLAAVSVKPLVTMTAPYEQHVAPQPAYFKCSLKTASMHRGDGKKLPFINGVLKTDIVEDIDYLRTEIRVHRNMYIAEATPTEVDEIEALLNPKAAMRKKVEAEMGAELREQIRAEEREKLLAEMSKQQPSGPDDATKLAGVDPTAKIPSPNGVDVVVVPSPLRPTNSSDIAHAAAGQSAQSGVAAAAAAALAASKGQAAPAAPAKK